MCLPRSRGTRNANPPTPPSVAVVITVRHDQPHRQPSQVAPLAELARLRAERDRLASQVGALTRALHDCEDELDALRHALGVLEVPL